MPRFFYSFSFIFLLLYSTETFSRVKLSGIVIDASTKKPIADVSIIITPGKAGTKTNAAGRYELELPFGEYLITVRAVGYNRKFKQIVLKNDAFEDFELKELIKELDEVEVKATKEDKNISSTQMGVLKIEMRNLKKIPVVFGETDIIKALTLQAGVTTVGEGAGGFNVRGGRVDQNLVLLDGMPIYNTSHLLGFLSSINADAIGNVSLYKSGVPAQYGGRLSSLLEMNTKNGNVEKITGSVGVGLISTKMVVDGPLLSKKITFLLAGRIAYPNFVIKQFPEPSNRSSAFFYDFNGKIQYKINDKNSITFSSYGSYDDFKFADDTLYFAKTQTQSLQFNSILYKKFSINLQAINCDYSFGTVGNRLSNEFKLESTIEHQELRASALFNSSEKFKAELGVNAIYYSIGLGDLNPTTDQSNVIKILLPKEYAREVAPYVSFDWSISPKISVQAGLRASSFQNLGPKTVFQYQENKPRSSQTITDSVTYAQNATIQQYSGLEPRVSLRFALNSSLAIKLNYNRMRQYIHLISNTTAISPVDFWKVSDNYIPPQIADQISMGIFKNFNENTFETSIEAYYKDLSNLVEYKNGARLYFNPNLETELLAAKGLAFGVEVSIQKNKGSLRGNLSYTYSRTLAKTSSIFPNEIINGNNWFPSTFDKPHNIALSLQQFLGNGWTFSGNFVYASGRPATYPDRTYRLLGKTVIDYSYRNEDRIPDYHRLDFSLQKDTRKTSTQKKYFIGSLSAYNFYGRLNPYSIYFSRFNNALRSYQLSVFGNIIPSLSITYNFL